jgi:hypothetical protein
VWRLQHARLPCGLYRASKGIATHAATLGKQCPHAACRALPLRPSASLSHIFLQCPAYEAARAWLQQLWKAIQPEAAPPPTDSAALMLGDDPAAWEAYPARDRGLQLLWTALRAHLLHAIWAAYWSREPEKQTSAAVTREVVWELRRLMRARFTMASLTPPVLNALPTQLLTAELRAGKLEDFEHSWAAGGVLCRVLREEGRPPKLELRLSLEAPVAAPV